MQGFQRVLNPILENESLPVQVTGSVTVRLVGNLGIFTGTDICRLGGRIHHLGDHIDERARALEKTLSDRRERDLGRIKYTPVLGGATQFKCLHDLPSAPN